MSSTILRPGAALRLVALAGGLICPVARGLAHEIPQRVTIVAFAKPESGRLRVVLRAPLAAMRDVNFPERALGYLDLARARPLAAEAAQLWIVNFMTAFEDSRALPLGQLVATRISLPSDKAFTNYEAALSQTRGTPMDTLTDVPWNQTALDVVIDYPITSERSNFALEPQLARLGVQTTTVLRFITADGAVRAYQYQGDPGRIQLDPRWYHAAWQFVKLGIAHILGGIDHLLFVLCLVIPFRRLRPLILLVTAFTVAHSITLAAAALGVMPGALWFPPLVETVIAASILYMALENIIGTNLQRRWMIAFVFGLIHGFGFSFALGESLQFAGSHLAMSLLAFNIGVEIGQIAVLAVAVPALSWMLRRIPERVGVITLSAFVAHTAWHWMTERGATLREYQITLPAWNASLALSVMRAALLLTIAAAAAWMMAELHRRLMRTSIDESSTRTADGSIGSPVAGVP